MDRFIREIMLIGKENFEKLQNSNIIIFGVGGVGSYVCEALARCGVLNLTLVDNDTVALSNINRQIPALTSTVGIMKTDVMRDRILDINEKATVKTINKFYLPDNEDEFPLDEYDYIIDCIDTVSGKISLAKRAFENNIKIISSMGTGNKLAPERLEITDLYKTSICPLARVMRRECKARGIKKLTVLYSKEEPLKPLDLGEVSGKRMTPASISFVPSVAGLTIASYVVRDIIDIENR